MASFMTLGPTEDSRSVRWIRAHPRFAGAFVIAAIITILLFIGFRESRSGPPVGTSLWWLKAIGLIVVALVFALRHRRRMRKH